MSHFPWWTLLAGIGSFMFGMYVMEQALQQLMGRTFKLFLRRQTKRPLQAVASGAIATALLQSSSMVSLMVMSLAGAGVIGLQSGLGLILGANLGTTATGWLVSVFGFRFDLPDLAYPLLALGGIGAVFLRNIKWQSFARALAGFSLMFVGIGLMRDSFINLADYTSNLQIDSHSQPWYVILGFMLAAALHSSSATVALALSSMAGGLIGLEHAMLLVIGADLGTTMTALLATLKSNTTKRRVGWSQILFNVFSASAAWLMLPLYLKFITGVLEVHDQLLALVSFHSMMNLVGILLVLPFVSPFCNVITWMVPPSNDSLSVSIHDSNPNETQTALDALHMESHKFLSRSLSLLRSYFDIEQAAASHHVRKYDDLKKYENEIAIFGLKMQRMPLSESDASELGLLVQSIRNAATAVKDIKDIEHNLDELRNSASDELFGFYNTLKHCQREFYQQLQTTLDKHGLDKTEAMHLLNDVASTTHRMASDDVYRLFSRKTHHEIMIPSLLNVIRAVNNSNESLMRSLLIDGATGK